MLLVAGFLLRAFKMRSAKLHLILVFRRVNVVSRKERIRTILEIHWPHFKSLFEVNVLCSLIAVERQTIFRISAFFVLHEIFYANEMHETV